MTLNRKRRRERKARRELSKERRQETRAAAQAVAALERFGEPGAPSYKFAPPVDLASKIAAQVAVAINSELEG